jgi:hypothetical protein
VAQSTAQRENFRRSELKARRSPSLARRRYAAIIGSQTRKISQRGLVERAEL